MQINKILRYCSLALFTICCGLTIYTILCIHFTLSIILAISFLFLIAISLAITSAIKSDAELSEIMNHLLFNTIPYSIFYIIIVSLLIINFISIIFLLSFPINISYFNLNLAENKIYDIRLILSVVLSGSLGGLLKGINVAKENMNSNEQSLINNFWSIILKIIQASIVSTSMFLIFRAGILKTIDYDTFNIYGVTGISIIAGYISDKIVFKIHNLYNSLFTNNNIIDDER